MSEQGKTPSESAVEQNVYRVFPNDLNSKYTVFGGLVMSLCDRVALIVAERHRGRPSVTAAVDNLHFLAPARAGDTLSRFEDAGKRREQRLRNKAELRDA